MDIFTQIIGKNQSILVSVAEIAVFTVLISLIIYHLIIYSGRRNFPEGKLYLYLSMLLSGLLFYIFLDTNMYYVLVSLIADTDKWTSFLTAVSWLLIFRSIQLMLNTTLDAPEKVVLATNKAWYLYLISSVLWLAPVVNPLTAFHREIFIIFWVFNGIFIAFHSAIYLQTLNSNKGNLERGIKIITITALLYIVYIWFYRLAITIYPVHLLLPFWLINNILKIGVAFTFAFALASRFNKEFSDLITLKEDLEKKVAEKTSELKLATKKAETASKIKTDYFINVAHETKTPLTLIGNYLDRYIRKQGQSEELTIIRNNFELLSESMIRFLDTEKFGKDSAGYCHDHQTDLSEMIRNKIPLFRELASTKNRNFKHETSDNIFIKADHLAAERVINNLFDNALKFTNEFDTISLTLKESDGCAVLEVADTGPGIDSGSLPGIFEPYFQAAGNEKKHAGLGMGLSIVKTIVDSLKGEIKVETNPGAGTVFTIILPVTTERLQGYGKPPQSGPFIKERPAKKTHGYSSEKQNILIIEDNTDMLEYLADELDSDYNVFRAANGIEALSMLKYSPRQDLILSDVMMDKMDGFELFEMISTDSRYSSIPFLFITARSNRQEKIEMLNRGVTDYLYKPFSVDELKAKITSALKNAETHRKSGINEAIDALNTRLESKNISTVTDKWQIFARRSEDFRLTSRQVEIIIEVEKGIEYKQIAEKFNISPKTVHRHMQILFEKFNVHSKIELLRALFE